ncbi:MAG: SPASM domain-containing protein [Prevotellaceae bacterium]|jgi:uncharacterized protein|nr:SPASM domain-containing protein [Prevotellaceae bacterium]
MKISNYTFLFENKEEYFIFNSLSKAFLQIDKESFDLLVEKQKAQADVAENEIDEELYEELKKRLFICENNKDEFLIYKSVITEKRNSENVMNLTIAPTMDCCFSCFYCFEQGNHRKTYITEEVMNALIKNIKKRKNLKTIHLTWFGGEPLMAIDKMQEFYRKFRPTFKGKFSSNIITTAFHIDERVIEILKEIEVADMQITLDGTEKTHNSIKFTDGCDNAFQKIISNIDLLVEKFPELHIVIRVNTTKKNAAEYLELNDFIINRYQGKTVYISPSIVVNRTNDETMCDLFNHGEFSKFSLDLWQNNRIVTAWLMYNMTFPECAIRNKNAIAIDPEGYIYQCWEAIGNKKQAVGKLDKKGNFTDINQKVLNRNLYGADPLADKQCQKCSYLPLCGGGCPFQRIENEFENGKNEICTTYKNHINNWLTTYLELKNLGYFSSPKDYKNEK